jgi:hypothetical protein
MAVLVQIVSAPPAWRLLLVFPPAFGLPRLWVSSPTGTGRPLAAQSPQPPLPPTYRGDTQFVPLVPPPTSCWQSLPSRLRRCSETRILALVPCLGHPGLGYRLEHPGLRRPWRDLLALLPGRALEAGFPTAADNSFTYLVTADYSPGFGSYSGPATSLLEISEGR